MTGVTLAAIGVNLVTYATLPESRAAAEGLLLLPVVLILAVVGGLVASRRPDNSYGWVLGAIGLLWAVNRVLLDYGALALARGLPLTDLTMAVSSATGAVAWGLFVTFALLLYPTGSLPGRRWRFVGWAGGLGLVLMGTGLGLIALELGAARTVAMMSAGEGAPEQGLSGALNGAGHVLVFATMIAGAVALFVRMRRADTIERLQLKWFAFGAALIATSILVQLTDRLGEVGFVLEIFAVTVLPIIIGIAILRWRLYEIDRIVSRTLAYGLLTLLLAGIYLAAVTSLTALTAPVTGDSPIAVAAATLLAAAAFGPARRRIQVTVDRRFNRSRYDAQQTVQRFAARMRDQVDLDELTDELRSVSTQAVQPVSAVLWLREGGSA